jgi:predicted Zn-dependent peptidase
MHFIKTDKFKTITVRFNFKRLLEKKEITMRNLLRLNLFSSNLNYKTERELRIRTEELYGLKYSASNISSGNYSILSFEVSFISDKFTEKGNEEKGLEFLFDMLFNPNIKDKKFDAENFKLTKKFLKNKLETINDNPSNYLNKRLLEETDKDSKLAYEPEGYLEDLNKIDEAKLYKYYLDVLANDTLDIFVIGNIKPESYREYLASKLDIKPHKKSFLKHEIEFKTFRKNIKKVKEKRDISQSKLGISFKLKNLTDKERNYVGNIFSYILGGGSDSRLFKEVREKNSLCYSINSRFIGLGNILLIKSGISKDNYEKALNLIKEAFMSMNKISDDEIKRTIINLVAAHKEMLDSPRNLLGNFESHIYVNAPLIEKRIEELKEISKEDVEKFFAKIIPDCVFFLEGGE